jgi:hypothetical protein
MHNVPQQDPLALLWAATPAPLLEPEPEELDEVFINREGTIGSELLPVSLVLSLPNIIVERSEDNGKTWARVFSEYERMEIETLIRVRRAAHL